MQRQLDPTQEAALVRQAQLDPAQFAPLYRAYVRRVYAYVAYRLKHRQESEDLTATIFTQVLDRLPQYDATRGSFSAWLFGITRHAVLDYWRRNHRDPQPETEQLAVTDELSPERQFIQAEQGAAMRALIARLPDRRQEVIILKFFGGLRNKEIAAVLELDERTVASHLCRALNDLKHLVITEGAHD